MKLLLCSRPSPWFRPILGNSLFILATGSAWIICISMTPSPYNESDSGISMLLFALHLLALTPSFLALIIRGIVYRNHRKLIQEREEKVRHSKAANPSPFALPRIPTREERLAERRVQAFCESRKGLEVPQRILMGVLFSGMALFAVVLLRLFLGVEAFGGDPAELDFGYEFGIIDEDTPDADVMNRAFSSGWTSYGRTAVGFFAALLSFPAAIRPMLRKLDSPRFRCCCVGLIVTSVLRYAPSVLSMLPVYNFFVTFARNRNVFAGSSFASLTCEWTYGLMIGIPTGELATAWTLLIRTRRARSITVPDDTQPDTAEERGEGIGSWWPWNQIWNTTTQDEVAPKQETQPAPSSQNDDNDIPCCVKLVERLAGLVLFSTMVWSSVVMATTWHNCTSEGDTNDCLNSNHNVSLGQVMAAFLGIPIMTVVATMIVRVLAVAQQS